MFTAVIQPPMNTFKTKNGTELPLMNIKGKAYLQVQHRLVWFREEHADWSIETTIKPGTKDCISMATIKDASGRVMATAHKYESLAGFPDYIEKSETGAIGRALALCGYGTQFTDDLDEGMRLADSPEAKIQKLPTTVTPILPQATTTETNKSEWGRPTRKPSKQAEHDASGEDFM